MLRRIPSLLRTPTPSLPLPLLLPRPSNRLPSQSRSSSSSSSSPSTSASSTTSPSPSSSHPTTTDDHPPPSLSPSQPKIEEIPVPKASSTPEPPPYNVQHFTPYSQRSGDKFTKVSEMDKLKSKNEREMREKAAVNMFINEGKMPGEIAELMKVKTGTVRGYFLSQSRSDTSGSIYHAISNNWQRASIEPGTYTFQDCKTMEDAYEKFDRYAAENERERESRGKGKFGKGGGGFGRK